MEDAFRFTDRLGPQTIAYISRPALALRAIVVVDNTAAGPAIGGTRMALDVSTQECFRLARAMTLKNSAAGLPHGGAKSVIFADPAMPAARKEELIRAFAVSIRDLVDYVPGPDMGTDEIAMAWVKDEIGRAVGLPREIGGIPLDEIGATGYGLAVAATAAQEFCGVNLDGARVVVQGFGAVGQHAARFLTEKGARLVGASDSKGVIADPRGLDVTALRAAKAAGRALAEHAPDKRISNEALVGLECDIWIPAARPDVIREDNVEFLNTRLFLQGANIPATPGAERRLHERGILSVPDFIANAGGVIAASVEYHGGTERAALDVIAEKIAANTRAVLEAARSKAVPTREAAHALAATRVERAMGLRRWHS